MPDSEKHEDLQNRFTKLVNDLKHGNLRSQETASKTVQLLQRVISTVKWNSASELITILKREGRKLINAQPSETATGNMVRRVLKIVRDEYKTMKGQNAYDDSSESLHSMITRTDQDSFTVRATEDYSSYVAQLIPVLMDAINELLSELETSPDNIASQSLNHIHSDEIIMTAGHSSVVAKFLRHAAKKRHFRVIVVETAPFFNGQRMAKNLADSKIETILITDAAVFAMMSRVNKVIIGTHTVMANGGLKAVNGMHALALAAKHHSVPLIVCAPMYKLSPKYLCSYDQDIFNKFVSPQDVLPFGQGELVNKVMVPNPVFDYVPPELVTLFISNIGGNAPSYVYRLLSELYYPEDHDLMSHHH